MTDELYEDLTTYLSDVKNLTPKDICTEPIEVTVGHDDTNGGDICALVIVDEKRKIYYGITVSTVQEAKELMRDFMDILEQFGCNNVQYAFKHNETVH